MDAATGDRSTDKSWQDFANCLGVDPDLFFPERGASTREAKEVCRGCVVREDCLEYALANGEKFGIWGGMSERERRRIRRQRALARAAAADAVEPTARAAEPAVQSAARGSPAARRASMVRSIGEVESRPSGPGRSVEQHAAGTRPDQLGPADRRQRADRVVDLRRARRSSGSIRFIDTCTSSPTASPSARTCGPRTLGGDRRGRCQVGLRPATGCRRRSTRPGADGGRRPAVGWGIGRAGGRGAASSERARGAPRAATAPARRRKQGTPSSSAEPPCEVVAGDHGVGERRPCRAARTAPRRPRRTGGGPRRAGAGRARARRPRPPPGRRPRRPP